MNPEDPYAFTEQEADIMERLERAFLNCEKLQQHMRFLLAKGSLYKVYNGNLLYHGCVPLNEDGSFTKVNIYGTEYAGKALYDVLEATPEKVITPLTRKRRKRDQTFSGLSGKIKIHRCLAKIR